MSSWAKRRILLTGPRSFASLMMTKGLIRISVILTSMIEGLVRMDADIAESDKEAGQDSGT